MSSSFLQNSFFNIMQGHQVADQKIVNCIGDHQLLDIGSSGPAGLIYR